MTVAAQPSGWEEASPSVAGRPVLALPVLALVASALSFAALLWGLSALESPGRQARADDDLSRRELHLEARVKALLADSIAPRNLAVSAILEPRDSGQLSPQLLVRVKDTALRDVERDTVYQTLWKGLALQSERGDTLELVAAPFSRQRIMLVPAFLAIAIGGSGLIAAAVMLLRWGALFLRPDTAPDDFRVQLQQLRRCAAQEPSRLAAVLRHWLASSSVGQGQGRRPEIDPVMMEQACQLLLALPEADAAMVIKRLPPSLVQPLAANMLETPAPGSAQLASVVTRALDDRDAFGDVAPGESVDIRELLSAAIGPEQARLVHQGLAIKSPLPNIQRLKWLSANTVVDIIAGEHPQLQAVVVAALPAELGSAVLIELDDNCRVDVLARLADLQSLSAAALEELDALIGERLADANRPVKQPVEGRQLAAKLLNRLDSADEASLLQGLRSRHPDSAGQIENHLFGFEQLSRLDRRDLRSVLEVLNDDIVATAVSGAPEALRSAILDAVIVERRAAVKALLNKMRPAASEVHRAREEVTLVARRMADAGEIVLDTRPVDAF